MDFLTLPAALKDTTLPHRITNNNNNNNSRATIVNHTMDPPGVTGPVGTMAQVITGVLTNKAFYRIFLKLTFKRLQPILGTQEKLLSKNTSPDF